MGAARCYRQDVFGCHDDVSVAAEIDPRGAGSDTRSGREMDHNIGPGAPAGKLSQASPFG